VGPVSWISSRHWSVDVDLSDEESERRLHNRLLCRSRQRGFLELELDLVGKAQICGSGLLLRASTRSSQEQSWIAFQT
ncbi:unnamed protein product, partial [Musa acuminata subsp. malaccensis]